MSSSSLWDIDQEGSFSGNHNDLSGLQGGTTNEYYHLTQPQYFICTQLANASQNGILSSDDWSLFNNKQDVLSLGDISGIANRITISGGINAIIGSGVSIDIDTSLFPSPSVEDIGKYLIVTDANTTAWSSFPTISHSTLSNLPNDDHLQYLKLTGRDGGQSLYGGTLTSQGLLIQANIADTTTGLINLKGLNTIINEKLELYKLDSFGRTLIFHQGSNAALKLGGIQQDGDPFDVSSEGIIVIGTNSNNIFAPQDWAFARIKSTRLGINNCINNNQFYLFRVDESGLYLKDDTTIKTFDIVRSTGKTYIKGSLGLNTISPRSRFDIDGTNGEVLQDCIKALTEATLTNILEISLLSNTGSGISLDYTIEAINTSTNIVEVHYGKYNVIARNQNGVVTYNDAHIDELDLPIGTGIIDTFSVSIGTNKITISLTATSGISPTSLKFYFTVKTFGTNSVILI